MHNVDNELSDSESIVGSKNEDKLVKETDLFFRVLATEADQSRRQQKKDHKTSQLVIAKRANLSKEIFYYIHVARCRRLYFLVW